ncbi:MAG: hypothetical protein AAGK97_07065, partial [Bacteroidota bacterium]
LKNESADLPDEEKEILKNLFSKKDRIFLDGDYQPEVALMMKAHKSSIKAQHRDFIKEGSNGKFIIAPLIIFLIAAALSTVLANTVEIDAHPHVLHLIIFVVLGVIGLAIYRYLIIQPSVEKINLKEEILGFKEYIATKLPDRSNLSNAPEMSVGHFESILPFAYALKLESNWSNTFDDLLKQSEYAPTWNDGYYYYDSFHGGLYRGISSTSYKAPDPSSSGGFSSGGGFSGGGFSGGGGGGGSVGGW